MARDLALLAARLLLAAVFVPNGWMKLSNLQGTAGYFAELGLPWPDALALGTGVFELATGLLLVLGVAAAPVSVLLAGFCLVAGILGHFNRGGDDPGLAFLHLQALLKDVGLAGGFLALAVAGPGRLAFARRR